MMLETNKTIFQFFHWYYSTEGNLWVHAAAQAPQLATLGVSHVWLPPAYKSAYGDTEPGYAVYDLYDLGEFDQKGSVRTRHGTKEEYLAAIARFHENGVGVLADIVLNHKFGGDEAETISVRKVHHENRLEFVNEPELTESYTLFTFPGRGGKYSDFHWNHQCFTGITDGPYIGMVMNDHHNGEWEPLLENELGNFDYLMGNDIEFRNPQVRKELKKWGAWYVQTTGIDGFRLDALKHINPDFFPEWIKYLTTRFKKPFFCIGEYWQNNVNPLLQYIDVTGGVISLFDVPLHHNFHDASRIRENYDMRGLFTNTLVERYPDLAITFVDNHDTQPLQSLESTVDYWFKPLANAIILLREQGVPCIFYPSVYEARYFDEKEGQEIYIELNAVPGLPGMMQVRAKLSYGEQRDYFDDPHLIGWTRSGISPFENSGCAVLLSNNGSGEKKMSLGAINAGRSWKNINAEAAELVTLDENGDGLFKVNDSGWAVYIDQSVQLAITGSLQ
ncbi:MAG: alpha-amylase [Chitinophagaceae bacterium]